MSEEIRTRFTKKDTYSVIAITVVMVLLTRLISLFTGSLGFLFYLFFFVPVFYLAGGAVLGWQVQKNSRIAKIIPVLLSSLSIFEIFYTNINYYFTFSAVVILLGNYCFFAYSYNVSLLFLKRKTGKTTIISWRLIPTIIIRLVLLLLMYLVYNGTSIDIRTGKYAHLCQSYLEDKFKQDFKIIDVSNDKPVPLFFYAITQFGPYLVFKEFFISFNNSIYYFHFSPLENPDLKFNSNLNLSTDTFSDDYSEAKINIEINKSIQGYLKEITDDYFVDFEPMLLPVILKNNKTKRDEEAIAFINKNSLTLSEVLNKYSDRLEFCVGVEFSYDMTNDNKEHVNKVVSKLMEYLKSKNIKYYSINLDFYSKNNFNGKSIQQFCKDNPKGGTNGIYHSNSIQINNNWHFSENQ